MTSRADNTSSSEKKSTEIKDLPTKEGNVESDESVKGGAPIPCVRAPRHLDKQIIPCIRPGGSA